MRMVLPIVSVTTKILVEKEYILFAILKSGLINLIGMYRASWDSTDDSQSSLRSVINFIPKSFAKKQALAPISNGGIEAKTKLGL